MLKPLSQEVKEPTITSVIETISSSVTYTVPSDVTHAILKVATATSTSAYFNINGVGGFRSYYLYGALDIRLKPGDLIAGTNSNTTTITVEEYR